MPPIGNPEDIDGARPPRLWDVYLLENGTSELNCPARALQGRTVAARSPQEARDIAVRELAGACYPIDCVPHGTVSGAASAIRNRARQREDMKARRHWSENGPDDDVRQLIGSRPRGGGW